MKATDFHLADQNGTFHQLYQYLGSWVLVYFYPKDDTPGCTTEACKFRDSLALLQRMGLVILGISKDSVVSHKKFAQKYSLNFPILSDESRTTIKAYGAWGMKKFMGRSFEGTLRKSFLIGPTGEIVKEYDRVNPTIHAQEILADVNTLRMNE